MACSIGERIRALRKTLDLTQPELALKLKVSTQVISNWERDYTLPGSDDLANLATFFDVSTDYLLYGVTPESRIEDALKTEPELLEFFNDLTEREDLQLLFKQVKPLPPGTIKRIIRYIQIVEEEEARE